MLQALLHTSHYLGYLLLAIGAKIGTDYAVMQLRNTAPNTPEARRWSRNWHAWGAVLIFAGSSAAAFANVHRYGFAWLCLMITIAALWGLLFDIGFNIRRALRWDYLGQEAQSDTLLARIFPAALLTRFKLTPGSLAAILKLLLALVFGAIYFSRYYVH